MRATAGHDKDVNAETVNQIVGAGVKEAASSSARMNRRHARELQASADLEVVLANGVQETDEGVVVCPAIEN
jgi:hypothetical protein